VDAEARVPRAELVVVDGGGHGLTADVIGEIVRATNRFADLSG